MRIEAITKPPQAKENSMYFLASLSKEKSFMRKTIYINISKKIEIKVET